MGTHLRSFKRYHLEPLWPLLPQDWGFTPQPKLQSLISQERVKLRTSNLAQTITESIHENILRKVSVGVSRGCPIFWVPPIISGMGKAMKFKFYKHIYRLNRNKSPLKISGKVAVGVVRDSRKFSGHPYIRRIPRSSLR